MAYTVKATMEGSAQEFWVTSHGGLGGRSRAVLFEDRLDASQFAKDLRALNGDLLELKVALADV